MSKTPMEDNSIGGRGARQERTENDKIPKRFQSPQ